MRPIGRIVAQSGAHKSCKLIDLTVSFSTYGQLYLLTRPKVEIFKRPKNRKDGSDFDDFGPNRSRRRDLKFEKFWNERRRHRGIFVVVIVAVVVAIVVVAGDFRY